MDKQKTIHLIGAQKSNFPWGFENRLIPALESLGWNVISTDFRQERNILADRLAEKADLTLVCKGELIPPQIISSCPSIISLWYAEQIGTNALCDEAAMKRREELAFNIRSFDHVFSHDQGNLDLYRQMGAKRVSWLPCAAVDPAINKKLNSPKKNDIVFIGSKTPRRRRIISEIENMGIKVLWPDIWDPIEMNKCFNESRIVLNLHLSDLLNTETRVAEVLGSGSLLISEELSSPEFLEDGTHYISFRTGDVKGLSSLIHHYLKEEEEREKIASQGFHYVQTNHTYAKRMEQFLSSIDFGIAGRIWPSYSLGFPFDSENKITLRVDSYYDAIIKSLKRDAQDIGISGISASNADIRRMDSPAIGQDDSDSCRERGSSGISSLDGPIAASSHACAYARHTTVAISKENAIDKAFQFADSLMTHSAWSISKKALKMIIEEIGPAITGILEFGAGYSTIFFAKWMNLNNRNISICSFEHNSVFWDKLSKDLKPFPYVTLHMPKLKQLSDYEYEQLFLSNRPTGIYPRMGCPVPLELYYETRLHNTFYDIKPAKYKLDNTNLIVIDGPNGNGRSIAFPLLKQLVRLPVYCLVDDFNHYPFLEEMGKCFNFSKIFEFDYGHDAYSFMKITGAK